MSDKMHKPGMAAEEYQTYMADGQMLADRMSELPAEVRCYISGVLKGMEISHALGAQSA